MFSGELRGISKTFGAVQANCDVHLSIKAGTIHALIGENGAGKSTAMKILYGAVQPDQGQILFDGKPVSQAWSPHKAFERGIGMVYQHFMLAETETVHDNLVLGVETSRFGIRNKKQEREELQRLMKETGLELPLDEIAGNLPISQQSRCEILKVLYRKARFLIFDEPTAVLTPHEIDDFLKTLKKLKAQGNTILIVTHKLKEVMEVADEVTVMRTGSTVDRRQISDASVEILSELMVGRKLHLPKAPPLSTLNGKKPDPIAVVDSPAFKISLLPGQIMGIAGVEGNGQDQLIQALTHPLSSKYGLKLKLSLFGKETNNLSTSEIRKLPMAIIPADRHREGLVLSFTLYENLRLGREQSFKRSREYFPDVTSEETQTLKKFDVRPPHPLLEAQNLSGGNQQKLIIARELSGISSPGLILAIHPTRGVDLGAIEFIHKQLLDEAAKGAAVLLISSELEELMSLSHKIGVFYQGSITHWFDGPNYNEQEIGLAMLGGSRRADAHA